MGIFEKILKGILRKEKPNMIDQDEHAKINREATALKESGNIDLAIIKLQKLGASEKLASYLSKAGRKEEALNTILTIIKEREENIPLPYNAHGSLWGKYASICFQHKDYENYLHAISLSIFYYVTHNAPFTPGGKEILNDFYKCRDVLYWNSTNFEKMLKKINKEYAYDEYTKTFMFLFDEIKKDVYSVCKPLCEKFTNQDILIFKKHSREFFEDFYNKRMKHIIF
jgi:hypothetical protein